LIELKDTDNIECHLQQIGMGSLICKAAKQTGDHSTNEISPENCFSCEAGKIFRELGCDAVLPKLYIIKHMGGQSLNVESLFCKIRRRYTSFEYCEKCNLRSAETTKEILKTAKGIFTNCEFYSAYKEIEKARVSIRDSKFDTAITNSISSLESTMKIIHEKMNEQLPKKSTVTDLYKSTRKILKFDEIDENKVTSQLLNTMSGLVSSFGSLRNALSDAHGKSNKAIQAQEYLAELALNTSSTLSTFFVRRFNELKDGENE